MKFNLYNNWLIQKIFLMKLKIFKRFKPTELKLAAFPEIN